MVPAFSVRLHTTSCPGPLTNPRASFQRPPPSLSAGSSTAQGRARFALGRGLSSSGKGRVVGGEVGGVAGGRDRGGAGAGLEAGESQVQSSFSPQGRA